MEITIPIATEIKEQNAAATIYGAVISGQTWSGVTEKSRFWASVQKAIEDGADVEKYVAPVVKDEKTLALEASDRKLLAASARTIEDIITERIADGKFVNDSVKAIIADRVNLRK